MAEVTALSVFGRLNRVAYDALDRAATHAKQRGQPAVEVVHWLAELLGAPDSDDEV